MNSAPIHPAQAVSPLDEADRLECLAGYDLDLTRIVPLFDKIAALGAQIFSVPICLISLDGADDQNFIGCHGLDMRSVPRAISFCDRILNGPDVAVVPDLSRDSRCADSPFVHAAPHARFYAGLRLITAEGVPLGSVCLIDAEPRAAFGDAQQAQLREFAAVAISALESRRMMLAGVAARRFVDTTGMAIVTSGRDGRITFWNAAAAAMFGYSAEEAVGRDLTLIMPHRFRHLHRSGMSRMVAGGVPTLAGKPVEIQAIRRDGTEFPIELTLSYWKSGDGMGFGAHIQDISARRSREARLQHLAHHDELTGLLNRRGFVERVETSLKEQGCAIVLALDLDSFKSVNDAFGHAVGDAFLQALAVRLVSATDDGAALARIGGDEFAILLPAGADLSRAEVVARTILLSFSDPVSISHHDLQLGISIGIAAAPLHAADGEDLMIHADLALFRAKHDGGRIHRIFDADMGRELATTRTFKVEIGRATLNQEWELLYQPQVGLRQRGLIGAEALLRWRHPERGLLTPGAFMGVLETHAAAFEVGCWVIDAACRQLTAWRTAGLKIERISVNLFAAQIRAGNLATIVGAALLRHRLLPSDLEVEITESIALRHDAELAPLRALHEAGVAIAFDDFGTGFASLTTLKRFPLSRLKIDQSFVADLCVEPHSAAIVEGMVAIGHRLGLNVIAEGIETLEQEKALRRLGCDEGQGYRYGRPMTGADLLHRFTRRRPSARCSPFDPRHAAA
ncbi:MAG TPA: EAL domain-containing protein [Sphingomonas sp.]|jgi:diguanylate cyclase (GGDEF)-like protein/PAS domain S-box-containing protein|uniref:putative bifunctional diguanylate cyclase/phosphodiesterase n=1 Tax=Sphingomonas sp. TaxID=28214 RepID=UPI002ED99043